MSSENRKISLIQAYFLLTMATAISNHVLVIPLLLKAAGRDAWLSVLVSLFPSLLLGAAVLRIRKSCGTSSVFQWVAELYGRPAAWGINLMFLILVLPMSFLTLKDMTLWVSNSFLPYTPPSVVAGSFILLCAWAAYSKLWTIAVCAGILLPVVALLGHFIMTVNFRTKHYILLTPLLENGLAPVLSGSVYAMGGAFEIILFLLIQGQVTKSPHYRSFFLFVLVTVWLMAGPVVGAIANFGPEEAARIRYPAFEQWRLGTIGKFISHMDFFSVYQWMSGSFIRISLSMYLVTELLRLVKPPARFLAVGGQAVLLMVFTALPISDMVELRLLRTVYYPAALVLQLLIVTTLILLTFRTRKSEPGRIMP